MPDEESKQPSASASLEDLISQAEKDVSEGVSDTPKPCDHSTVPVELKTKCPLCLWYFCDMCASPFDPKICKNCMPTAVNFKVEELVSDDGVHHNGKKIVPDPDERFFNPKLGTLAKNISEMKYTELELAISYFEGLIKVGEQQQEVRRIALGSMKIEKSQRDTNELRKLKAVPVPKQAPKKAAVKQPSAQLLAAVAALFAAKTIKPKGK